MGITSVETTFRTGATSLSVKKLATIRAEHNSTTKIKIYFDVKNDEIFFNIQNSNLV